MSVSINKRTIKKISNRETPRELTPSLKVKLGPGIVHFYLHGSARKSDCNKFTTQQLIDGVQTGLAVSEMEALGAALDEPMDRLAPRLGISKATWQRRKSTGRLGKEESDRVVRFARLMGKALEIFETEPDARRWLNSPQYGLGGAIPLDYAETEIGAREVEDLLGRIEYGVYS